MKAQKIFQQRMSIAPQSYVDMVIWRVPTPVLGSVHPYKYRLAYVVDGVCVVRFDNERGKGDHFHFGDDEQTFVFTDIDALLNDFKKMIERWNNEHGNAGHTHSG